MQPEFERLTDDQWEVIKQFLNYQRKRQLDLREVVDAILFVTRCGIQWRNLKETSFPDWQAVYYYFDKWSKNKVIDKINLALNRIERIQNYREDLPSLVLADSQSIKLAPMIFEHRGIDGNKNVNGRKRHLMVDVRGRIFDCQYHAANIHDTVGGQPLIARINSYQKRLKKIMTDKSYRGQFAEKVRKKEIQFEVPQHTKKQKGFVVEAKRWVVERSFAWLNFFRRVNVDHEHTPEKARSFVLLANISMCLWRIDFSAL
jgi:transposase